MVTHTHSHTSTHTASYTCTQTAAGVERFLAEYHSNGNSGKVVRARAGVYNAGTHTHTCMLV